MNALLVVLLAVVLAPDSTRVALDREGWPVAKDAQAHSVWWWSSSCAPQKLQGEQPAACGSTRAVQVRIADPKGQGVPGATVLWGTAAMLRDLPDDRLPSAIANEHGLAEIAAPANEEIWARATAPATATPWTRVAASANELRLGMRPALPLRVALHGEDDRPVLRARVALVPSDCTRICPERIFALGESKNPVTVKTLRGATYRLVVWSDSHAPAVRTMLADEDLTLELPAGAALDARLTDGERKPVAGATFEVQYRLPELAEPIRRTAAAADDGRASLTGLPLSLVEWTASAPSFARRVDQAALTGGSRSLGEVVLSPARQTRMTVREAAGGAVSGARIVARGSSFAVTDEKGVALLRDLPAGDVDLEISAEGFLSRTATITKDDHDLVVTLERGAAVKATLLRQSGGAPGTARVRIANNGRQTMQTVDLSEGLFLLSGLRGGTARLTIQADGAAPYDTGTLEIAEGKTLDLGIVMLATGGVARGTIVDDQAAPILAARIRLLRTDGDSPALAHVLGNWSDVASAEDGTFELTGLQRGSHLVVVEARGFAQRVLPGVVVSDEQPEVDLGTVALEPGRTVELVCRPEKRCGTEASILIAGADYPFLAIRSPLQQGRGTFRAVPTGSATLRLTRSQHVTHERSVSIAPGREIATLEIDLPAVRIRGDVTVGSRRAREGSLLFTRAVHSSGVPIMVNGSTEQGTTIDKQWLGAFSAPATCNLAPNGEFLIEDLEPGPYDVVFRSGGASTTTVRIEVPGVAEHHLPLRFDGAEIAGTVHDEENRPAAVRIEAVDASGATHAARSGLSGEFRILGLSGGRAHVKAAGGGKKAEADIDTNDETATSMVLRLVDDPASGLSVNVFEADGSPVAGALVFAISGSGVLAASTDREGHASLRDVSGGAIPVAVHQPGGRWAFTTAQSGEPARLVLPARPGAFVANSSEAAAEARILTPGGFPLDRVLPMVGISPRIGSGSSLRVPGLPPGSYDVSLGMFRKGVTVASGTTAEVRLGN